MGVCGENGRREEGWGAAGGMCLPEKSKSDGQPKAAPKSSTLMRVSCSRSPRAVGSWPADGAISWPCEVAARAMSFVIQEGSRSRKCVETCCVDVAGVRRRRHCKISTATRKIHPSFSPNAGRALHTRRNGTNLQRAKRSGASVASRMQREKATRSGQIRPPAKRTCKDTMQSTRKRRSAKQGGRHGQKQKTESGTAKSNHRKL